VVVPRHPRLGPHRGRRLPRVAAADRAGARAPPTNANAAHGLAHVFYETRDAAAGAAFVESWLRDYERAAQLHCHLSWHLALFELARGGADRAWELYDRNVRPSVSLAAALITLTDAASLLWRFHLRGGAPASLPWAEVRDHAARAFPRAGVTFGDLHCALAFAAAGDQEALSRRVAELEAAAREGRIAAGPVVPALARALGAFAREDHEGAIALIEPVAGELVRIGGSRAQRDVFEETLVAAYLRAGALEKAEALQRRERRCP
jgi:hypothetical protein